MRFFPHTVTVWKLQKFTLTPILQKFLESNVLTKVVTKELISRKMFSMRENFMFFHTVHSHSFERSFLSGLKTIIKNNYDCSIFTKAEVEEIKALKLSDIIQKVTSITQKDIQVMKKINV